MSKETAEKYKDIIDLPHHVSETRQRMSVEHRAAQFSSFSALSGYEEKIAETARVTSEMIELSQEKKDLLSRKLAHFLETGHKVRIVYFSLDPKKSGGEYKVILDAIRKIEEGDRTLILKSGASLFIDYIVHIGKYTL